MIARVVGALVSCIAELPAGWTYADSLISRGAARFWLDSDRAGLRAVEVTLAPSCDTSGAVEVGADEPDTRTFSLPISLRPRFLAQRFYVFPGGCVTYRYSFVAGAPSTLALEADEVLAFVERAVVTRVERAVVTRRVHEELGLTLCGVGAPPCAG